MEKVVKWWQPRDFILISPWHRRERAITIDRTEIKYLKTLQFNKIRRSEREEIETILIPPFLLTSSLTSQFSVLVFWSLLSGIKINKQKKITARDTNLDPSRLDHVFNTFTLLCDRETGSQRNEATANSSSASATSFDSSSRLDKVINYLWNCSSSPLVSILKFSVEVASGDTSRVRIMMALKFSCSIS